MVTPVRCMAFVAAALALAGCCTSGDGCYVADPAIPTAWDGQGTRPGNGTGGEPRHASTSRVARSKTEIIVGPIEDAPGQAALASDKPASRQLQSGKSPSDKAPADKAQLDKQWAQDQAADQAADARLAKQLQICRNCTSPAGN
jgi:hypothetical protein